MKPAKISLVLFVVLTLTGVNSFAQQEITLTTTRENLVASKATIEMPGLANNPEAIIVATPIGDTVKLNPHPIGVWYYNDQWNIFNTDHASMPAGLKFRLQVFLKPDANQFLHIVTRENLSEVWSYLDHPALNDNPKAQIKILQNHAAGYRTAFLNQYEATTNFDWAARKWYIKNVNDKPLSQNMAYNIVIWSGGTGGGNDLSSAPMLAPIPVATRTRMPIVLPTTIPTIPTSLPTTSSQPVPVRTRTRMPIVSTTEQPIPTTPAVQPKPSPAPSPTPANITAPTSLTTTQLSTADPCTKETAYQKIGKWGKQRKDDLAMADRTFPKEQFKPVLAKAQKVIDLFMRANPEFKGIEAYAQRTIRGDSYVPNGALPFRIDIGYGSFHCIEKGEGTAEERGKIIVFGGYGYTTVYFNSLRDVLESVQDGGAFLTTDGEEIFDYKKQLGEFNGFTMIEPMVRRGNNEEAIIITPDNRLPYKPVTREQYLLARIKNYGTSALFAADAASLKSMIARMSPGEKQTPALVRDITASPSGAKIFAAEAEGGKHLVTIDKSFFNPKLPRETIQFITVHWNWNDTDVPKAEAMRQFKQNFDFAALRQMLGK